MSTVDISPEAVGRALSSLEECAEHMHAQHAVYMPGRILDAARVLRALAAALAETQRESAHMTALAIRQRIEAEEQRDEAKAFAFGKHEAGYRMGLEEAAKVADKHAQPSPLLNYGPQGIPRHEQWAMATAGAIASEIRGLIDATEAAP